MKRTLALLIAVLMVVGMLPMTAFAAAGQELSGTTGHTHEQETPAPDATEPGQSQTPAEPTADDYFAVYDAEGALVDYYATLADADKALADGYTLKVLQSYTTDTAYAFGAGQATPISFTIDGNGAVITANVPGAAWQFGATSAGDKITVKNLTIVAAETAILANGEVNIQKIRDVDVLGLTEKPEWCRQKDGLHVSAPGMKTDKPVVIRVTVD